MSTRQQTHREFDRLFSRVCPAMESVEVRNSSPAGGNTADPPGASSEHENSPTEKQNQRKKKKGIRAFFRRIGKTIGHIFGCDEDDMVSPFPCSDPTDVQPALDSEIPGPSGLGPALEKQKKGIRAFLRRFQKGNKVAPDRFADEPVAHQDPADQTDPEPLSVSSPTALDSGMAPAVESSVLGPSSCEVKPVSMGLADPEPNPVPGALDVEPVPGPFGFRPDIGSISSFYEIRRELGRGAFGIVCEGTRRSDGQKVAVKFQPKKLWDKFIELPGSTEPLVAEVAVNLLMRKPPTSPHIVEMLDWFDQPDQYVLIMEYPHPCEPLFKFTVRNRGLRDETLARGLMRQIVLGAKHFVDCGVDHRDIHTGNILVNTETLQIKFIDFGCSTLFNTSEDRESVVQSTVSSLGRVLLEMVSGSQELGDLPSGKRNALLQHLSNAVQS